MLGCSRLSRVCRPGGSVGRRIRAAGISAFVLAGTLVISGCGLEGTRDSDPDVPGDSAVRPQVEVIDLEQENGPEIDETSAVREALRTPIPLPAATADSHPVIDPEVKLTASDGAAGDMFGASVSHSAGVALIAALADDDNGQDSGSAYIYRYNGSDWVEEAKLLASDGSVGDYFGSSVSLLGEVALIGADSDDDNGLDSGSAYVFRFNGSSWVEEAKLTASDGAAGDLFGNAVSLSGDVALIGANYDDDNGAFSGSAYLFRFDGNSWVEEAKLIASDGAAFDEFGSAVALSGNKALVGAYGDSGITGSAYVFRMEGTHWVEEAKLTAAGGVTGDFFGTSVALHDEVALIGAFGVDDVGSDSGAAYVFRRDLGNWTEVQKLTAIDGAAANWFGYSVALNGSAAAVGARFDSDNGLFSGSAYMFIFDQTSFVQETKYTASDGVALDEFGSSVSLAGAGAVVGAPNHGANGSESGAAYVVVPEPGTAAGLVAGALVLAALKRRRG